MSVIPFVIEKSSSGERSYDIYSRLLKERIVFLGTDINSEVANAIVAQLLFLESDDPTKDVYLYIQSPGGYVTAAMAIYDTMQYIKPAVQTICIGNAASAGALLLAAGEAGKRFALPNARIMIHQPLGGYEGQASDIEIHAKEMIRVKHKLNEIIASHTGKPVKQVAKDTDRDYFMTAEEAKAYGIIDEIITKRTDEKTNERK